jgi:SAM-dependent methyltransferase
MRRRIGDTGGAAGAFAPVVIEGRVTGGAPGRAEEAQAGPAGRAEAMVRRRDRAAARAARRQREIRDAEQGSAIVAEPGHTRLVPGGAAAHKRAMPHNGSSDSAEIFDRALRRKRRDRAARRYEGFLREHMLEGIRDRLAAVTRNFRDVLDLGSFGGGFDLAGARIARIDAGARFAAIAGGVQADEDRHPFPEASFDLVVSVGVLDQVNDVPGALALARRALRPDGLFLGAFLGAGTLATLRSVFLEAEGERPVARFHPQIDVRAAGDLLTRAGFALPVADVEALAVRYSSMFSLLGDLRGMAATNLLPGTPPLTRTTLARAAEAFAGRADPDGKTAERFEIVYLTGWAPDESQPRPARRGSATASLAEALKGKR